MAQHHEPILTGAEPQLFVGDIRASCDFFTVKLGFEIAFMHGEPPFYAQVVRDQARLNLRHVDQPLFDNRLREREDLLSAIITLDSADGIQALFREIKEAGAPCIRSCGAKPGVHIPSSSRIRTAICCCSPGRRSRAAIDALMAVEALERDRGGATWHGAPILMRRT